MRSDGITSDLRGAIRWMVQPDEEHVELLVNTRSRVRKEPDTARSAISPTHAKAWTNNGWDPYEGPAGQRRARVVQGTIEARSNRKERQEGDLEGEQGPGRIGQRTPEYGDRWYGLAHGARPRGTSSRRYGRRPRNRKRNRGTSRGPAECDKSEEARDTVTWTTGSRRRDLAAGEGNPPGGTKVDARNRNPSDRHERRQQ